MATEDIIPSYVKVDIYKITNTTISKSTGKNKQYVGQTRTYYRNTSRTSGWKKTGYQHRFREHFTKARSDKNKNKGCRVLNKAIHKYGEDAFIIELVETCLIKDADNREIYWVDKLNTLVPNGYNLDKGGQNIKDLRSKETLDLISEKLKQSHLNNPDIANRISASMKKRKSSSVILKVKDTQLKNITISKKVSGVHIDTGEITKYNSIAEASRNIKCGHGKLKYYRRYKWSFI